MEDRRPHRNQSERIPTFREGSSAKLHGLRHNRLLLDTSEYTHATGGPVTFEPGARTAWHTHPPEADRGVRLSKQLVSQKLCQALRRSIAVAMDEPPSALLAAEDMRHADRQRDHCVGPGESRLGALNPNTEGKVIVCARAKRDQLNAGQLPVCEARGRQPGVSFDSIPSALEATKTPKDTYIIRVRPQSVEWLWITSEQGIQCRHCPLQRRPKFPG
jgi:hypothetical protein